MKNTRESADGILKRIQSAKSVALSLQPTSTTKRADGAVYWWMSDFFSQLAEETTTGFTPTEKKQKPLD